MKQWFIDQYWEWKYARQYDAADSIYAWWWTLKWWLKYHPRLIDCAAQCGNKLWANKNQDKYQPQFCSENCAYYGVDAFVKKTQCDEIPF